ncbi:MAG: hypothetical protein AAFU65_17590 [Pseudomonadota bacterium]
MRALVGLALAGLTACQSAPRAPATLAQPGPEARASIAAALKAATGRDVLVDNTAFARDSALYITPRERRAIGAPRMGRIMTEPLRFDLVLVGGRCELVDSRNNRAYELSGVMCTPLPR